MRQVIYDEVRDSFTGIKTPEGFELAKEKELKYKVTVEGDEIKNLFTMTPFYHRSPWQGRERLAATESLEITVNCVIHIYRKIREM
jgi:23S rRNA (guanine745-N1)-methyltransferase